MKIDKMKYVTLNAVIILGLLPLGTTLLNVETAKAEEYSLKATQGNGFSELLNEKFNNDSKIGVDTLSSNADALSEIVNQQANTDILDNYSSNPGKNSAMTALYKAILISGNENFSLSSLTNQISTAQLLINGKSSITSKEIKDAETLTVSFNLFSLGDPNPSTSETVVITVNQFEVSTNPVFTAVGEEYVSTAGISVKNPSGEVVNPSNIIVESIEEANANGVPKGLIEKGLTNSVGTYINAGSYEEKVNIKVNNNIIKSDVSRTITVGIGEYQPSIKGTSGQGVKYDSGETINDSSDTLTILGDDTTKDTLKDNISRQIISQFYVSEKNKNSSSQNDYTPMSLSSLSVDVSGIDLFHTGTYMIPVTYSKPGSRIVSTFVIPVKVTAVSPPVIRFTEGQNLTLTVGDSFDMMKNINVFENQTAAINPTLSGKNVKWSIMGEIDTNKAGTYELTYIATNTRGAKTELNRIITVENPSNVAKIESFVSVGNVNYVPGYGIRVWGEPNKEGSNYYLPHGSAWKIDQKATFKDGAVWYRVGKNQWVEGKYISFAPVNSGPYQNVKGMITINYVPGYSVNVYSSPMVSSASWTSKQLKHGTKWEVFMKTTINGTTFYNVGGNQWINAEYAVFSAK